MKSYISLFTSLFILSICAFGDHDAIAKATAHNSEGCYVIVHNDTLKKIAKAKNIGLKALYELNRETIGNNPDLIFPGQVLVIPQAAKPPEPVKKIEPTTKIVTSPVIKTQTARLYSLPDRENSFIYKYQNGRFSYSELQKIFLLTAFFIFIALFLLFYKLLSIFLRLFNNRKGSVEKIFIGCFLNESEVLYFFFDGKRHVIADFDYLINILTSQANNLEELLTFDIKDVDQKAIEILLNKEVKPLSKKRQKLFIKLARRQFDALMPVKNQCATA
ncbi:MAG: Peptidase M23 [Parcubacteria group bacterium GW2011_GWE2_38_18]|nr:MAG: Peptidase M23 [Parcubacteria group bacterium GW2011_GWE2_38_18]